MHNPINRKTKKLNVFAVVNTRDLDEIRPRLEKVIHRIDRTALEVMPGVWHLMTAKPAVEIKSALVGAVTDNEDDRILLIYNPDGCAGWDGHRGQYVRMDELAERFIHTDRVNVGNSWLKPKWREQRFQREQVSRAAPAEWSVARPVSPRPSHPAKPNGDAALSLTSPGVFWEQARRRDREARAKRREQEGDGASPA